MQQLGKWANTKLHPGPEWGIGDVISRLCMVSEKWRAIDFMKFSEADVKSFSEKQENVSMKNKTS